MEFLSANRGVTERLYLTDFREPEWNVALMDSLVLKETTKKMLQNLCRLHINRNSASAGHKSLLPSDGHPRAKAWTADYIDDKGKGFVVLLHGKPGVGKTYTAECIAHTMKRPLLSITTADIGVDPSNVEPNLRRWFNIARLWDAVLLIDEADIYFESRQTQDLERNNLVASFLRAIEYYDGILFLTTNRVGTSDEAVWSRIHATIYYDNFTEDQRQKIWNTYFDKLEQERGEEIRILESAKEYVAENKEVKDLQWNGRQIRNGNLNQLTRKFPLLTASSIPDCSQPCASGRLEGHQGPIHCQERSYQGHRRLTERLRELYAQGPHSIAE